MKTTIQKTKTPLDIEVFLGERKLEHDFNPNLLSEDFSQYLQECCIHKSIRNGVNLRIYGTKTDEQRQKIIKLIHAHYEHELKKVRKRLFHLRLTRFMMFLLGVLAIVISQAIPNLFETQRIASELFMIAGWVFIWELIYDISFSRSRRIENANIINKLAVCSIEFAQ